MIPMLDRESQMEPFKIQILRSMLFLVCFALLSNSCKSQQVLSSSNKHMYEIIFADGFSSDSIVLMVNEKELVDSAVLTSDKSDGVTNLWVTISKKDNEFIIKSSLDKIQKTCSVSKGNFEFKVYYKSSWHKFIPRDGKGEYIIIDAIRSDLKFTQQIEEPLFD